MTEKEADKISTKIATVMADIVTVKYCDDLPKGIRVFNAYQKVTDFVLNNVSPDMLEAVMLLGETLKELQIEHKKETGRTLF